MSEQPMHQRITPMILTLNEEDNLERTLAALDWAPEILVIDSGSTDRTLEILAANPRVRVVTRTFDTHANQCNFGLDQVKTDWVLSIDADYELSRALSAEIGRLDPEGAIDAYSVGFVYRVFGKALRATLYPPRTVLYRRRCAHYIDEGHTQRVVIDGRVGTLEGIIFHDDRKPIDRWFRSQIGYSRREADYILAKAPGELNRVDRLRRRIWMTPIIMPFYTLLARGCVLDGRAGFYYAAQRTFAELMLSIELLDRRIRR